MSADTSVRLNSRPRSASASSVPSGSRRNWERNSSSVIKRPIRASIMRCAKVPAFPRDDKASSGPEGSRSTTRRDRPIYGVLLQFGATGTVRRAGQHGAGCADPHTLSSPAQTGSRPSRHAGARVGSRLRPLTGLFLPEWGAIRADGTRVAQCAAREAAASSPNRARNDGSADRSTTPRGSITHRADLDAA